MSQSKKVTLDAVGCCAMTHAFLRHPAYVREMGHSVGQFHVFYEIFQSTLRLSFTPNELSAMIYRSFAMAEMKRLSGHGRERLLCRHGSAAHVLALEQMLAALPEYKSH